MNIYNNKIVKDTNVFAEGPLQLLSALVTNTWAEPYLLASRIWGEQAEKQLEPWARLIGTLAGQVLQPIFQATRMNHEHVLEDNLKATRLAENLTGILGADTYVSETKVTRRVHTCPFRHRPGAKIICHLGESAGQELFAQLVPGTRHKVHVTMARGHDFCEYSYEIDEKYLIVNFA